MGGLLPDSRGAAEIPLRLVAYALLAAAFTAVAYVGLSHTAPAAGRVSLERDLGILAAALDGLKRETPRNTLAPGPAGASRQVSLAVPSGAWASLGGDADPDGNGVVENGTRVLPEQAAVYRVRGDAKRRVSLPMEVREGLSGPGGWLPASQPLVLHSGSRRLTLEAVLDPVTGERVALAWANDGLDLPYSR